MFVWGFEWHIDQKLKGRALTLCWFGKHSPIPVYPLCIIWFQWHVLHTLNSMQTSLLKGNKNAFLYLELIPWSIFPEKKNDSWIKGCLPNVHFSSVFQLCLTLCDPMDCSRPGLPVHHQLPEFAQTHVHQVSDATQPSHPLSSLPPAFSLSQHQGLFQGVSSSHQVAKVLEFQLQHQSFQWVFKTDFLWSFRLVWSPCSPRDSGVFSNTTVQKHKFFGLNFLYGPTLTSIHNYWKNHSFD